MAGFDGTWNTVTKTPLGDQEQTLTLQQDGGTLTGTTGALGQTIPIANGTVDGNHARWTVDITAPMAMTITAEVTVDGDALTGTIDAGAFGKLPFSGTRG